MCNLCTCMPVHWTQFRFHFWPLKAMLKGLSGEQDKKNFIFPCKANIKEEMWCDETLSFPVSAAALRRSNTWARDVSKPNKEVVSSLWFCSVATRTCGEHLSNRRTLSALPSSCLSDQPDPFPWISPNVSKCLRKDWGFPALYPLHESSVGGLFQNTLSLKFGELQ